MYYMSYIELHIIRNMYEYIYIYIYMCVCILVCVDYSLSNICFTSSYTQIH